MGLRLFPVSIRDKIRPRIYIMCFTKAMSIIWGAEMKERRGTRKIDKGVSLLLSIILVFCIFGTVVFSVSRKISEEMSESAIQNLSESLDLIKSTIEASICASMAAVRR